MAVWYHTKNFLPDAGEVVLTCTLEDDEPLVMDGGWCREYRGCEVWSIPIQIEEAKTLPLHELLKVPNSFKAPMLWRRP